MPEKGIPKNKRKGIPKNLYEDFLFFFLSFFVSGGYDWRRKTNQTKSNQGSPDKVN